MAHECVVIGDCTLYRGDCREILPDLPPVDAVVTDPPYGVGLKGKRGHYRHEPNAVRQQTYGVYEDTAGNFEAQVLPALTMGLKQSRTAAVFMGSRNLTALPAMDDVGGFFLPNGCGIGRWGFQTFMHVALYGKDPYLLRGARPNGRYGLYGNDSNAVEHPCAKPLAAMTWAVDRVSLPGWVILDPFMGSGTTGVACVQLGRKFIGIEIDPHYFAIACKRIEQAYAQPSLFPVQAPRPVQQKLFEVA